VPLLDQALLRATRDESPRVREAAFLSLASRGGEFGVDDALRGATDDFAFVRAAALGLLARGAHEAVVLRALDDRTVRVRVAALDALAKRPRARMDRVTELLEEPGPVEVQERAALTLGAVCARSAGKILRERAEGLVSPVASADERRVAIAAADALSRVDPAAFQKLLATLRSSRAPAALIGALEQRAKGHPPCP
jgi:hypothetical protein